MAASRRNTTSRNCSLTAPRFIHRFGTKKTNGSKARSPSLRCRATHQSSPPGDSAGGTEATPTIDKLRPSLAEFPNAVFRNRGLRQFLVRGLNKVKAVTLWQVLAFHFTRIHYLGWLPAL